MHDADGDGPGRDLRRKRPGKTSATRETPKHQRDIHQLRVPALAREVGQAVHHRPEGHVAAVENSVLGSQEPETVKADKLVDGGGPIVVPRITLCSVLHE